MEPEDSTEEIEKLHDTLQKIADLEGRISAKGKVEFGDPDVIAYNHLVSSLQILSLNDLMQYRGLIFGYAKQEVENRLELECEKIESRCKKAERKEGLLQRALKAQEKEILDALQSTCSPDAYSTLQFAIKQSYRRVNLLL